MISLKSFPFEPQMNTVSCGLACIKAVAKYYGKIIDVSYYYRSLSSSGLSIYDLCEISEEIGFRSYAYELDIDELISIEKPIILHWNANHYIVFYKYKRGKFYLSDPAKGLIKCNIDEFTKACIQQGSKKCKIVLLEPSERFTDYKNSKGNNLAAIEFLFRHLAPYKRNFSQLFLVMVIIALVYATLPFITRSIIDVGIEGNDLHFITVILIANISLLLFKSIGEWIRSTISLHIASRIKISIITDYLIKVFSLPIATIESMLMGDIMQRSNDQERIQQYVSNSAISILMSIMILLIYSIILFIFDKTLFFIFLTLTILYVIWIMVFYQVRKKMDIKYYELMGKNQSVWIEILKNFEDIKVNNYSLNRRWKWEKVQGQLYKVGIKFLNVDRLQQLGADFINGLKDIGLTFYAAYLVIEGEMSLGTLISIQFIIGQLTTPVADLITFIKSSQSAFISFLRVNEINKIPDEQKKENNLINQFKDSNYDIYFKNVGFKYKGSSSAILNGVSFKIPENKITAIVGTSGCGKTTVLKLLTKVYDNYFGDIYIGDHNLKSYENEFLREKMGVVFQDSNLYKDTILNNIIMSSEGDYDYNLVNKVLSWVNLKNDIHKLPLGVNSELQEGGKGLSQGQKQRLILARALYKKPKILILDEATNAIDSISEKMILDLLNLGLKEQTKIIISHKLSTIRIADFIIVMEQGRIIEVGTFDELLEKKAFFYLLFKEQLNDHEKI